MGFVISCDQKPESLATHFAATPITTHPHPTAGPTRQPERQEASSLRNFVSVQVPSDRFLLVGRHWRNQQPSNDFGLSRFERPILFKLFIWLVPGGGVEPPRAEARRILSPILGRLQQAARERTDSHNLHRIKDLRAISILQDVAVNGTNVGCEHAPEHALNH